jgi:membrane protease YdiL (CAAX protease family)
MLPIIFSFIAMAIIIAIISGITGLSTAEIGKNKILALIIAPVGAAGLLWRILQRSKNNGVQSQYLIGNISLQNIPWMMILIVFYGIETLQRGLNQLTLFCVNLVSPSFIKSELAQIAQSNNLIFNYHIDSLALKVLFYGLIVVNGVIVSPLIGEFLSRGLFLHRFSSKWGITAGIIISSALSGLFAHSIYSVAIGIVAIFVALTYIKIPSLLVPIAYYAMHNIIWMISKFIENISDVQDSTDITLKCLWLGLLNISFALPILSYFLKWPNSIEELPYNVNSQEN